jgi:hypothetical protein
MRRVDNAHQTAGTTTNFNNYQFDFGLGKGSSNAPLKDQQKQSGTGWSPWTASQGSAPTLGGGSQGGSSGWASSAGWSNQQTKPAAGGAAGSGYSSSSSQTYGSSATSTQTGWAGYQPMTQGLGKPAAAGTASGLGIGGGGRSNGAPMKANAKLAAAGIAGATTQTQGKGDDVFGDLLGAAMKKSNVPINAPKSVPSPVSSFSMGNLNSSLPKTGVPGGQISTPMAKMGRSSSALQEPVANRQASSSAERDPFPPVSASSGATYEDDYFGFPSSSSNAAPPSVSKSSLDDPFGLSGSSSGIGGSTISDPFVFGGSDKAAPPSRAPPPPQYTPVGDPFDMFNNVKASPAIGRKPVDPLEALAFAKSTTAPSKAPPPAVPVQDDGWGMFGGGGSSGSNEPTTTELEGLPPPPPGVTAEAAAGKGSEFYKNGQFPDAIKWLSWSFELLRSSPDKKLLEEILTCRVSCFKEIGEMKKAVADCSKAIELQPSSVTLLMLRSNLYESMEKYKLGVADLKLVMKLDNGNLKARQSLQRLERMANQ